MPRATDGQGKTDDYRPVDQKQWERGWLRGDKWGFKCPLCNKDGSEKHINDDCKLCKGIGYLDKKWWEICEYCQGADTACLNCNGTGYVLKGKSKC